MGKQSKLIILNTTRIIYNRQSKKIFLTNNFLRCNPKLILFKLFNIKRELKTDNKKKNLNKQLYKAFKNLNFCTMIKTFKI